MKPENRDFSDKEIEQLQLYRDEQEDGRLKMRFVALLLLAEGVPVETVASVIGKSVKTIERWLNSYLLKGIDSLNSFQYKPKKSFLSDEQMDEVVEYVKKSNPSTKEVQAFIKTNFEVEYSIGGVSKALKKKGLKF